MRLTACMLMASLLLVSATPAMAQDLERQEIIVTGSRIDQDDYSDYQPAVGLRRQADFLVQQVVIRGDTRDSEEREREIRAMLLRAIERAGSAGVELAQGTYIVTRLTPQNAAELELVGDRRPDSELVSFLIKAPLAGTNVQEAQRRIAAFVEGVPEVGRAQMDTVGDPTLSIVGPDSYRDAIIAEVAADSRRQAALVGADYAIELAGLNMPVQWTRAGPGEVLLFIPYELRVVPRP
ncbi:TonB-dependent receptor [Aurantiacibacter luteus]|uniref:TonB-dependent receptor n=2 Tax=Aurantiacibacter luteus TaxID=1581420 RepID=A0A0G9N3A5_9SPHN|nr:TonB-dependent receptor [Aurantiacibacter luteus]